VIPQKLGLILMSSAAHKPNAMENFKVPLNGAYKVKIDMDIGCGVDPDSQRRGKEGLQVEEAQRMDHKSNGQKTARGLVT